MPRIRTTNDDYTDEEWYDITQTFADPGGPSSLRRASKSNPRNLPCPNCDRQNVLTPADRALGYQCDICANQSERGDY